MKPKLNLNEIFFQVGHVLVIRKVIFLTFQISFNSSSQKLMSVLKVQLSEKELQLTIVFIGYSADYFCIQKKSGNSKTCLLLLRGACFQFKMISNRKTANHRIWETGTSQFLASLFEKIFKWLMKMIKTVKWFSVDWLIDCWLFVASLERRWFACVFCSTVD